MRSIAWLQGSLAAITAAVVGVIANLSIWFALHVLFRTVGELDVGIGSIWWPHWSSLDLKALAIGLAAGGMLFGLKWGIIRTLAICALAGLALGAVAA